MTTRTYTAPTCTLIVSSKQPRSGERQPPQPIDFILHLDCSDRDKLDDITLNGQPQQLDYLHQLVSQYIAALVAKFPISNPDRSAPAPADLDRLDSDETAVSSEPEPNSGDRSSRFGILKNLPGLRNSLVKLTPASKIPNDAKPSISKLLGDKSDDRQQVRPNRDRSTPRSEAATAPYFTGSSDRALDHQLYLGNLGTVGSGEVLTLSAIQLFDLATVLDEYVAEHQILSDDRDRTATFSRADIPAHGDRVAEFNPISTPPSRLPNLPNIPGEPAIDPVYYRTRRSQSSFMSAIPWAVAAALAVGVPLLILDPNPNPLKDAVSKVKIFNPTKKPDLATAKKPAATLPSTPINLDPTVPTATPTPWQAQPVQPPQVIQKPPASINTPQNPSILGTALLPDAIANKPATAPTTTASGENVLSGIAANPPNSTQPPAIEKIDSTIERKTTPRAKPDRVATPSSVVPSPATTMTKNPAAPGKLSVSKRPMLIPSPNLSPIVVSPSIAAPVPFNPPVLEPSERLPKTTKTTTQKVQPTPIASKTKPKPAKSIAPVSTPSFEPFAPIPRNPNLINPNQNDPDPAESQAPPIVVPDKPLQSNAGAANAEAADAASLQETKRYFQGKWKATPTQTNSLQYVVQVSGKSGIVQNVSPQGEAATAYLQQTKFVKPGQKLISPAAAGSSDRKIRVLLQPDGNVDTFTEP
ncbi:DUF4335 domain-containing protein [Chamaesiphon sp.]|uniref:DUF4335 domain-containing protein n=1 Tax=Chamaesiphon sp. TaxID=2814140 RepID=UPI0035936C30